MPATPEDVSTANELISIIGSPAIADAMDLSPFLIRRCGGKYRKTDSLHISIRVLIFKATRSFPVRTQDQWEEVSINEAVLKTYLTRFADALDWVFPRQKRSMFRVAMRVLAANKVHPFLPLS